MVQRWRRRCVWERERLRSWVPATFFPECSLYLLCIFSGHRRGKEKVIGWARGNLPVFLFCSPAVSMLKCCGGRVCGGRVRGLIAENRLYVQRSNQGKAGGARVIFGLVRARSILRFRFSTSQPATPLMLHTHSHMSQKQKCMVACITSTEKKEGAVPVSLYFFTICLSFTLSKKYILRQGEMIFSCLVLQLPIALAFTVLYLWPMPCYDMLCRVSWLSA